MISDNLQISLFSDIDNLKSLENHSSLKSKITLTRIKSADILEVNYFFEKTQFGNIIIATSNGKIIQVQFIESQSVAIEKLKTQFKFAVLTEFRDSVMKVALTFFHKSDTSQICLEIQVECTEFQLAVWQQLLKIPFGKKVTYGKIAKDLQKANGNRAVGTATGKNPIAFLIPCHRVSRLDGDLAGYRWGIQRKLNILQWERSYQ